MEVLEDRTLLAAVAADDSYSIDEGSALRIGGFAASENLITEYDATAISGIAEGDPVPSWTDLSGNGNDATATQAGTFAAGGIGGRAAVDFDLHDNYLSAHQMGSTYGIQGDASWTMVWVAKVPVTAPGTRSIGAIGSGGGVRTSAIVELDNARLDVAGGFGHDVVLSPTNSFSQFVGEDVVLTFRHEGGTGQPMLDTTDIFVNGYAPGEGALASNFLQGFGSAVTSPYQIANTQLTLGGGSVSVTPGFDGLLAEIHLYDSALSDDDLAHVEYALGQKYGIAGGFEAPPAVGLLDNDSGTGPLSASLVSGPANGTLTLDADGSLLYTPNVGFTGVDSFTYRVNDGTSDSNVATVSINVADVQSPADLVSFWPAEGHADDTVSGNDGILQNGTGFGPGYTGQAFQFDGSSDFVSGSLSNFAGGDSEVTIAAWFNQDGAVGHPGKGIFGIGSTQTNSHFFLRTAARGSDGIWDGGDGQNRLWIGVDDNGADKWWASNAVIDPGQWYHAAATYSPATREVSLYIDGQLDRTITLSAGLNLTTDFWIGGDAYADNFFNGRVDEPRLYSRTLTAHEVALVHNTNFSPPTIGALAASPSVLLQGTDLTLTVDSVTTEPGNDAEVAFYWDADANGLLDTGTDVLLGVDDAGSDGWNLTAALTDIPAGTQSFLAQATDSVGQTSSLAATSVEVLPAVYWDGGGGDFQWANPLNWSGDTLPGSTDDVVINVPAEITVEHQSGSTNVRDLYSAESLTIGGGSLTVSGDAAVLGLLTVAGGATLRASGPTAHFQNSGGAVIDRANLIAVAGGRLELSGATTYVAGVGDGVATLLADGAASQLTVSDVTSMSGFTRHGRIEIRAENGGMTSLPNLSEITGGSVQVIASDASSEVNLPALANWADTNQYSESSVRLYSGGTINLTSLASAQAVAMQAFDGETLTLPALSSISGYFRDTFTHLASGAGSVVSMPVLTTASGSLHPGGRMQIQALDGGLIDMPQLANITGGATRILARDAGSTINMPALTEWIDDSNYYESAVQLFAGGTIHLTSLASAQAVAMQAFDGETLTLPALDSISGYFRDTFTHLASGAGSVVSMPVLTTASGSLHSGGRMRIHAIDGGQMQLPQLREITGGVTQILVSGPSSAVSTALETWARGGDHESYLDVAEGSASVSGTTTSFDGVRVTVRDHGLIAGTTFVLNAGSQLTGVGTIRADVQNNATVQPGDSLGRLTINGDFENSSSGNVVMELGGTAAGTQHDQLVVTGIATLDGTLNISLANGFTPASGNSFQLLQFDSRVCDFLTKNGTDLGNGLHLAAAFDLTSMTLNAGSTPDSGQQCQTIPVLTNVDVGPDPAKAGDDLSITFEVDVALSSTPDVTVAGNAATFSAQNGSLYTFTYTVAGIEPEGDVDVEISATSLDGGIATETISTELDFTSPIVSNITPSHEPADVGTVLTVSFSSSEPLSNSTEVLIGGQPASRVTSTSYSRLLTGDEGLGLVTVEVAAVDLAGNTSSTTGEVLIVSGGLDVNATSIDLSDDRAAVGQTVAASVSVHNSGFYDAGNVPVRLTLVQPDGAEVVLLDTVVPSIVAGGSAVVSADIDLTTAGVHVLRLDVDPENVIPEITELDNVATRSLMVDSTADPVIAVNGHLSTTSVVPGGQVTVTGAATYLSYLNPAGVAAGSIVDLNISSTFVTGTTYTNSDGDFASQFDAPLLPGDYVANVTLSDVTTQSLLALPFTVTAPPGGVDFYTTNSLVNASDFTPVINNPVTLSARIYNIGGDDFGGATNVRFYDNGTLISTQSITGLASGASAVVSFAHTFTTAGPHAISAIVDEDDLTAENNESNNSGARTVTVLDNVPDLTPTDIVFSDNTPATTDTVTITAKLRNFGGSDATDVVVRFFDGANPLGAAVVPAITADGGTEFVSIQAVLPTAGQRNISVVVDPDNAVVETDETNNTRVETIVVHEPAPDLVSSIIQLSNSTPVVGDPIDVSMTVVNSGELDANAFDATFFKDGTSYGTVRVPGLAAGASTIVTLSTSFSTVGSHSVRIDLDSANELTELSETNNTASRGLQVLATPLSDLRISGSEISLSDSNPGAGDTVTVTVPVRNIGQAVATGVTAELRIDGVVVGSAATSPTDIAAGQSADWTFDFTAPAGDGFHLLEIVVDQDNLIGESNENNNRDFLQFLVGDHPDLVPSGIAFSNDNPVEGDVITISATVTNDGDAAVGEFLVRILDGSQQIGQVTVPSLAIGASEVVGVSFDTTGRTGTRLIQVIADPGNLITEFNEGDNLISRNLTIASADAVAPVTVATPSVAANAAGWNNTDVDVVLTASDNGGGSGVAYLRYSVNGGPLQTTLGDTQTIAFTSEGLHTIAYQAVDFAQNTEALQTLTVRIDKTAPVAVHGGTYDVAEGSTITLDGTASSDPLSGIANIQWALDGDGQFNDGATPSYAAPDGPLTVPVQLRVTDEAGNETTVATEIIVSNVAPTANAGSDVDVPEGSSIALDGSGSSDPGDDIQSYLWDLDGDGSFGEVGTDAELGDEVGSAVTFDASLLDGPESRTVKLRVTDDFGAVHEDTVTVSVTNVGPAFEAGANVDLVPADEGIFIRNNIAFTDPGAADVHTVVVNFGDGTGDQSVTLASGLRSFDLGHTYDSEGQFTVSITVSDDDGEAATDSFIVDVDLNTAPETATDANPAANEVAEAAATGSLVGITAEAVDADNDTLTYSLDNSAGGRFRIDSSNGIVTVDNGSLLDGPQTHTITVRSTDPSGEFSTANFSITVTNVAPTVAANNPAISVAEGSTATNAGSFADVGDDTVAVTASVGVVTQDDVAGTWAWSWDTSDGPDESQTVTITATDSDGAATTTTFNLTVTNVAPTVAANNAAISVDEGSTATNAGSFADVGDDTVAVTASVGVVTQDDVAGTWAWSWDTSDGPDESQTVTITATDSDGAATTTTFDLTVNNVAPTVAANNATVSVDEGSTATNAGNFADVGDDTVAITASIGTITQDDVAGTWAWSWDTSDGPDESQTVTITATDSDGAATTTTFDLTVTNVAPTVAANNATVSVDEGSTATNAGSFADVGDDTVAVTASVGVVTQDDVAGTWAWSWDTSDGPDESQTVTITATDSDGAATTITFDLTVTNVAPTVSDATFEVLENSANGTVVGTLTATDPGDDSLTFSITGGTGASAFTVDPVSGTVSVADHTQLDFETTPVFTLEVAVTDEDGASDTALGTINLRNQATISGVVYVDTNQNGNFDANEVGIDGVTVELLNEAGDVLFSTVTDDGGLYFFEDMDAGTYRIRESQPSGVTDGPEQIGSEGGSVVSNDVIQLSITDQDAGDYNFAEYGQQLSSGDTAGIGFWQNKHGQALIAEGGTELASWLTENFGNIFGSEFVGATGADVAVFYKYQLFKQKGKKAAGPAKVDAQFMAVAFATFFTSSNLAGSVATNYGFNVSDTGIGTNIVNVGNRGAAFNVDNHTDLTILQLLLATNALTDVPDNHTGFASIYDRNGDGQIDSYEAFLRTLANDMFSSIND
ncbi:MAG: hypothetical protein Fues2KO_33360 [Fuerstiella sp.]